MSDKDILAGKVTPWVDFLRMRDLIAEYVYSKFPLSSEYWHMDEIEHYYVPEEKNAIDALHFKRGLTDKETTWLLMTQFGDYQKDRGYKGLLLSEPRFTLVGMAHSLIDIIDSCISENGSDKGYCILSLPLKSLEGSDDKEKMIPVGTLYKEGFCVDLSLRVLSYNVQLVGRSLIGLRLFDPSLEKQD